MLVPPANAARIPDGMAEGLADGVSEKAQARPSGLDFKLALRNIGLVADPPYGVKGEIKKTVRRQGKKHNLHNAAERPSMRLAIDKVQIGLRDRIRRGESVED